MIRSFARGELAIAQLKASVAAATPDEDAGSFPHGVVDFLARLRLLERVPFGYLVPDDDLLPPESIRFFYLNRNWTDAAVAGALAVGTPTTRDQAHLQTVYGELRAAVDAGERRVAGRAFGDAPADGPAEVVTGFLLRSRAVSGWPGLHVRGFRTIGDEDTPLRLLRMERLAPAVLLVLMDGVPRRVEIEEPRAGTQFGVDPPPDPPTAERPASSRWVKVRDPGTGLPLDDRDVRVPFRSDAPGVIDVTTLRQRLLDEAPVELGEELSAAELALQLLQFPFRQEFGESAGGIDRVLLTTVPIQFVRDSARLVVER
jgi:hypothetical protein